MRPPFSIALGRSSNAQSVSIASREDWASTFRAVHLAANSSAPAVVAAFPAPSLPELPPLSFGLALRIDRPSSCYQKLVSTDRSDAVDR